MGLNHQVLNRKVGPVAVSWEPRDAMLYALGVGAGQVDPLAELAFTGAGSDGQNLVVLPFFAVVLMQFHGPEIDLGAIDPSARLHAEQSLIVHSPLPARGTLDVTRAVTGIYDKTSAAIVTIESTASDPATGAIVATAVSKSFIRGAGGFGGPNAPAGPPPVPQAAPDLVLSVSTRADQALLYRLSGDYNPLHVDKAVAARAGYERPILHGLCTYGIAGRALLSALCDADTRRFRGIFGRFTKPVLPGERLTIRVWISAGRAAFQVCDERGAVVIDRGQFDFDAGALAAA